MIPELLWKGRPQDHDRDLSVGRLLLGFLVFGLGFTATVLGSDIHGYARALPMFIGVVAAAAGLVVFFDEAMNTGPYSDS